MLDFENQQTNFRFVQVEMKKPKERKILVDVVDKPKNGVYRSYVNICNVCYDRQVSQLSWHILILETLAENGVILLYTYL